MDIWNIVKLLGGLALFIFGMNLMGDGLKLVAGNYLKKILEKLTQNKVLAMAVGAGLTALIQSSNAMCAMVVGFVNAGIMTLERSVGILMGAKIGTTITGQLIAFNISDIAPVIAFIGVAIIMFTKKQKAKYAGQIVASLGVLFIGLGMMSESMKPLAHEPWFTDILGSVSNPILGVLIGVVFTVVIQSASASVGVLQMMVLSGMMGFHQAFFIMMGMNIGASVAPALAAIGGRKDSKRAALIVALFESIGMIIFLIIGNVFPSVLDWIAATAPGNASRQIANANTIFNLVTVIALLPCSKYLVKISEWFIRGKDATSKESLHFINESGYQSGTVLIGQIDMEIERMHKIVRKNLSSSVNAFLDDKKIKKEKFDANENIVNFLNREITNALIQTGEMNMPIKDAEHAGNLYHIVTDLERIGDHAKNIHGYAVALQEHEKEFSGKALKDLKGLAEMIFEIYDYACEHFKEPSKERYAVVYRMENSIDDEVEKLRQTNIKRLGKSKCEAELGLLFSEVLIDLERVADHCMNIAKAVKQFDVEDEE